MARQPDQKQSDPVVAAIERVLKTERDGVQKLQQSEDKAQTLLGEGRAQGAAIGRRAEARITKIHAAYLQKIEREIQALREGNRAGGEHSAHPFGRAMLEAAARRLAARLTGAA